MSPLKKGTPEKPVRKAKTVFRKGTDGIKKGSGSGMFLPSIGDGEAIEIVPLVDMAELISADFHEFWDVNPFVSVVCLGDGCPGCETGNEPKFKAFLPIVTRDGETKIFSFGISITRQLEEIEEGAGAITGKVIRIKRKGSGRGTKYNAVNVGKSVDISKYESIDIEQYLGPTSVKEIRALLLERGLLGDDAPTGEEDDSEGDSGWGDV